MLRISTFRDCMAFSRVCRMLRRLCVCLSTFPLLLCPHNFSDVHYDSGRQLCMPLVHRIGRP